MELTAQKISVSFVWRRALLGYKWENAVQCNPWGEPFDTMGEDERGRYEDDISSAPTGPFLLEKHPNMMRVPAAPLEDPLLFAQFADIAPTEESFLDWANKHGRLIEAESREEYAPYFFLSPFTPRNEDALDAVLSCEWYHVVERDGQHYLVVKPDPLSFWKREHRDLSFAVLVWELAVNRDPRLNGIMKWHEDTRRVYAYPFDRARLEDVDFERLGKDENYFPEFVFPPHRIEGYHPERFDVKKAAMRYVLQEINRKFAEYPLATRLQIDEREQPRYILKPGNLLSAMWYQLFLAQMGEIRLKRCAICGRWENMAGHRESWKKHANCANYDRVKRARDKKKGKVAKDDSA